MERPEVQDVYKLLRELEGLIVHFSGCPPMHVKKWEEDLSFPADLKRVIAGGAQGGVSCSVALPGDVFAGPNAASIGSIGVILRMKSKTSLKNATSDDHGTSVDDDNNRIGNEQETLTLEDLAATLRCRTKHSEWVLRDFKPIGLFAAEPYEIWQRYPQVTKCPGIAEEFDDFEALAGEGTERKVGLAELRKTFPGLEIYSFAGRNLGRWEGFNLVPARHEVLYPLSE